MRFRDRVAVVTGGGSGIGARIAEDLCREGAVVHIIGRQAEKLSRVREGLDSADQSRMFCHSCDVGAHDQVQATFSRIEALSGLVTCLVNGAAINPSRTTVAETSYVDWETTLHVNLTGGFNCIKSALLQMRRAGGGSIVNIASITALVGLKKRAAYSSSKAGLVGLTRTVAFDYAEENIRANCVCPGYVRTELTEPLFASLSEDASSSLRRAHPLGRLGTTDDVSRAVSFLLSDDASWITGVILPVDGGFTIGKDY